MNKFPILSYGVIPAIIFLLFIPLPLHGETVTEQNGLDWPRMYELDGHEVVMYQPQPEKWVDYKRLTGKAAIAVLLKGESEPEYGAIYLAIDTITDMESRKVKLLNLSISKIHFPNVSEKKAKQLSQLVEKAFPGDKTLIVSLDRILASLEASKQEIDQVEVNLSPPPIFYSESNAILVVFLGEPRFEPVKGTPFLFAVNTNWDILMHTQTGNYYLLNSDSWLTTTDLLKGVWKPATAPKALSQLPADDNWNAVRKHLAATPKSTAPKVFVSNQPAELILIDGSPAFSPIPETNLLYITNSDSTIFLSPKDGHYYILIAGRWFRSKQLNGPWRSATKDLPKDFLNIPPDHKMGEVLVSVPGSIDAEAAVLLASVPKKVTIDKNSASVEVNYSGSPQFELIKGTSSPVYYGVNTENTIFRVGTDYYVCHQAVWFSGSSPTGPWVVASSVPKVIYTIPATHPTHNVTYVYVYESTPETVVVGHTSGYVGAYVAADVVMFGLGVWALSEMLDHHDDYHHYHYHHAHYFSYGCGAKYSYHHGGYYRGGKVYGPYGGAGRGAMYDPVSGTYHRGAYRYGPNGGAFAREAYNPHTGRYAGQVGASNPYGSWGRSVVSDGNDWARAGHRSTARGTVAGFETSEGAVGIGRRSNVTGKSGFAVKDQYGDTYVGRDGNIYKKDNGSWQKATPSGWETTELQRGEKTVRQQTGSTSDSRLSTQKGKISETKPSGTERNLNRQQGDKTEPRQRDRASSTRTSTQKQNTYEAKSQGVKSNLNRQYQGRQLGNRNSAEFSSQRTSQTGTGRSSRSGGRRR